MGGHRKGRGGPMGGRRPLRFLAWRLGLSDEQFRAASVIISDLKTARAAAHVERRRASSAYAAAVASETISAEKLAEASAHQEAADRVQREAVAEAIRALHALLDEEQRASLAMLLREAPPWML